MVIMRHPLCAAVVVLLSSAIPASSSAEVLVGFGQISVDRGEFSGEFAEEFARTNYKFQLGAGLRYSDVALSMNVGLGSVESRDQSRHGYSTFGTWLGPELRFFLSRRRGFQPYVRAGVQRVWFSGSSTVTRYCAESRTCTGGFWMEDPDYKGWATRIGVGLQYSVLTRDGAYVGFWLDAGYDALDMEVVENHPQGGIVNLTLGVTFGGGRTR